MPVFFRKTSPEEVVRIYGPLVYRHLRRIFGPRADVDDIYQAVFIEVLRSLPHFKGRAQLGTWIRRITWNVAYDEMRRGYRHDGVHDAGDETPKTPDHETCQTLYAGIAALDEKLRLPLLMHDIEGMTLKEISQTLGRPLPTVASQVQRAREAIARYLRDGATTAEHPAAPADKESSP